MNKEENKPGRIPRQGKRVTMVIPMDVYDKLEVIAAGAYRTVSGQAVFQICKSFNHEITENNNTNVYLNSSRIKSIEEGLGRKQPLKPEALNAMEDQIISKFGNKDWPDDEIVTDFIVKHYKGRFR